MPPPLDNNPAPHRRENGNSSLRSGGPQFPVCPGREKAEAVLRDQIVMSSYQLVWSQLATFNDFSIPGDVFTAARNRNANRHDEMGLMVMKLGKSLERIVQLDLSTGDDTARGKWYRQLSDWAHSAKTLIVEQLELHL